MKTREQHLCTEIWQETQIQYFYNGAPLSGIQYWINQGANINYVDSYGWTPLHLALRKNNGIAVEKLIKAGASIHIKSANVDAVTAQDLMSQKLCSAIWEGKLSFQIDWLIKHGVNINYVDSYGWTPLHLALRKNNEIVVEKLIKAGADANIKSVNIDAITPIELMLKQEINPEKYLQKQPTIKLKQEEKQMLFILQGTNKEHHRNITDDPQYNLVHPKSLSKYFTVIDITPSSGGYTTFLDTLKKHSASLPHVNILLDVHGEKHTCASKTCTIPTYNLDVGGFINANKFMSDIATTANGKIVKIFSTACYGANLHDQISKLPKHSSIITLSGKDTITNLVDTCHPEIPQILDTLVQHKGNLELIDLLLPYIVCQRVLSNVPSISINNDTFKDIIKLDEYFSSCIKTKTDVPSIIKKIMEMRGIKNEVEKLFNESKDRGSESVEAMTFKVLPELTKKLHSGKYFDCIDNQELVSDYSPYYIGDLKQHFVKPDSYQIYTLPHWYKNEAANPMVFSRDVIPFLGTTGVDITHDGFHITPKHSALLAMAECWFVEEYSKILGANEGFIE